MKIGIVKSSCPRTKMFLLRSVFALRECSHVWLLCPSGFPKRKRNVHVGLLGEDTESFQKSSEGFPSLFPAFLKGTHLSRWLFLICLCSPTPPHYFVSLKIHIVLNTTIRLNNYILKNASLQVLLKEHVFILVAEFIIFVCFKK